MRPRASGTVADPVVLLDEQLERVLLRPTFVLFSGGVDSSLLLARLSQIARRLGLADPVPITYRYGDRGSRVDHAYQDLVMETLGLHRWHIIERESAEVIGDDAARVIREIGLPPLATTHVHLPAFELAGGSPSAVLITGEGGDETLGPQRSAVPAALALDVARHLRRPGIAARHIRSSIRFLASTRNTAPLTDWYPWLTEEAVAEAESRGLVNRRRPPLQRLAAIDRTQRRGVVVDGLAGIEKLARRHGVELMHPLSSDAFVRSLVTSVPRRAFTSRAALVHRLWPGVVPEAVLARREKAVFTAAYFGDACREFARSWNGDSLRSPYVDNERLRAGWLSETHAWPGAHLLQAAWAADAGLLASA